jgi:cAMP phosphodiesterase
MKFVAAATKFAEGRSYSEAWLLKEKYQAMNLYGRFIINHCEDIDHIVRSGILQ